MDEVRAVTATVTVTDARDDDGRFVPEFYRTVLMHSFPPDELDSLDNLLVAVRSDASSILIAHGRDGGVVGGAIGDRFPDSNVMLLSYLAIRSDIRSGGVGSTLLRAALADWTRRYAPDLLLLEVEDPRYFAGSADHGDPVARVRFYERFGARVLPLPYLQPALVPGLARVPKLMLMVIAGTLTQGGATHVPGRSVEAFLTEYFSRCEGPCRADDEQLHRLLAAAGRPAGLPLLAVDDLPPFEDRA